MSDLDRDVYFVEHLQVLLGFDTKRGARRWLRDAGVPFVKVGKRIIVRRAALLVRLAEIESASAEEGAA